MGFPVPRSIGPLDGLLVLSPPPSICLLAMPAVGSIYDGCNSELDASTEAKSARKEKPSMAVRVQVNLRVLVRAERLLESAAVANTETSFCICHKTHN